MIRLLAFALALAVGGCTTLKEEMGTLLADDDTAEPPTPLVEFTPLLQVSRVWARGLGSGTDDLFVNLAPVADAGTVYGAERDGEVTAIAIDGGSTVWESDTDARLSGGPGVGDGLVLVGSTDGELIALEQGSGDERWRAQVSSEVLAAPQAKDGIVVVRTGDGKLAGLSGDTGRRVWVYDRTVPVLTLRGTSPPVLVDDYVIAGFDNGRLVALELRTGRLLWEQQVAVPRGRSDLERMVDIDAPPVVVDGTVYVATFQGRVAALTLATGEIEWSRDISSATGLAIENEAVYVSDEHGVVWSLDRRSGASIWKQENLKARSLTGPASLAGYVVVGDLEGYLHWLRSTDGEFAARAQIDNSKLLAPPIIANGMLIGYSSEGELAAYAVQ